MVAIDKRRVVVVGIWLFFIGLLVPTQLLAQCTNVISQFPYKEGFELAPSWVSGGQLSDWEWGTPQKKIITRAASGNKCWITGGLTNSAYGGPQISYLLSPCFDFSAIQNPFISCKLFWETERRFDGGGLEYSIDGGVTWKDVGNANDVVDCNNINWYNQGATSTVQQSWAGTILTTTGGNCVLGSGVGSWITAKHTMSYLAGKTNVRFRFTFTAGRTCNNFDGFAVDDIFIGDIPKASADFGFTCSKSLKMQFTAEATGCVAGYSWNFGDPVSVNNTATIESPEHVYSAPGTYNVVCSVKFQDNTTLVVQKQVTVFSIATKIDQPIACAGGNDGRLSVQVIGGSALYSYLWSTNPPQNTPQANGVGQGIYTIQVQANGCTLTDTISLTHPQALKALVLTREAKCGNANGSIGLFVEGGTAPFTYKWSNGTTLVNLTKISAGKYAVQIRDSNLCLLELKDIVVKDTSNFIRVFLGNDTTICNGSTLVLNAGSFDKYRWQDSAITPLYNVVRTGTYSVRVTDADGCTATDSIRVTVDCSDIFFPTAFTPNGDYLNQNFGPVGNVEAVKNYQLQIFNRLGQLVFSTRDPNNKWDGKYMGKLLPPGTALVWMAVYSLPNRPMVQQKGTVVLVQ